MYKVGFRKTATSVLCMLLITVGIMFFASSQVSAQTVVSKVVQSPEGKYYVEKDGKPLLYLGIQNVGTTHLKGRYASDGPPYSPYATPLPLSWLENVYEKTQGIGYKVIQQQLSWLDIESTHTPGVYDWTIVDQYVDWANKYDLYIDVLWFGTNVGGGGVLTGYDYGWNTNVPPYLQDHDKYWNNGNGIGSGANTPHLPSQRAEAVELFAWERQAVRALFDHLAAYDTNHRVVLFQVNNEPNLAYDYESNKMEWISVLNDLAREVKESDYVVATRVNLASLKAGDRDYKLHAPYIDFTGPSLYASRVEEVAQSVRNRAVSNLTYIAENSGAESNQSSLTLAALVNGGFYDVYQLNDAWTFWNQGLLNATPHYTWTLGTMPPLTSQAVDMSHLNTAMNKIAPIIAAASPSRMAGYNIATDHPVPGVYSEEQSLLRKKISFQSTDASVGMVVNEGEYFYALSDTANASNVFFTVEEHPLSVTHGYIDENGSWVSEGSITVVDNGDDTWSIPYLPGQVTRFELTAMDKYAIATSSNPLFPADAAIDGNASTAYVSADFPLMPASITVYYDQPQVLNEVSVSCDFCQGQGMTDFDVQVSTDGIHWETAGTSGVIEYAYNDATLEQATVYFAERSGVKAVRLQIKAANQQWNHFVINELKPSRHSNAMTAVATSVNSSYPASYAIDGDMNRAYMSADNPALTESVTVYFNQPRSLSQAAISCDFCLGQGINDYEVQVTTEGVSWGTVAGSGPISYLHNNATIETSSVSFPTVVDVTAVRILIHDAHLQWNHFVINELTFN